MYNVDKDGPLFYFQLSRGDAYYQFYKNAPGVDDDNVEEDDVEEDDVDEDDAENDGV